MSRSRVIRRADGGVVSRRILIARTVGKISGLLVPLADLCKPLTEVADRCDYALGDGAILLDKETIKLIDSIKADAAQMQHGVQSLMLRAAKADNGARNTAT